MVGCVSSSQIQSKTEWAYIEFSMNLKSKISLIIRTRGSNFFNQSKKLKFTYIYNRMMLIYVSYLVFECLH
jgi:hypothetical protein